MSLEINEELGLTIFFTAVVLVCGACALGGCHMCEKTKREAVKAGLVQKNEPSGTMQVWTKP